MDDKYSIEMATFRFGLIAPVINETYKEPSKMAYYRKTTLEPIKLPDGTVHGFSPKTLAYWECIYRSGGFEALRQRPRSDAGHFRKLDEVAIAQIKKLKRDFPKISAVMIYYKLIEEGTILRNEVSLSTVQRYMKNTLLYDAVKHSGKDRKAFEAPHALEMIQADTLYGPYITEDGKKRRTYLIMIIDDYSRLIVGGRFFYADNAANFQSVLKGLCLTYGIPKKCYVDNGAPYRNEQLQLICGNLGCVLLHAPVRDGSAKGKVERAFKTLRLRMLNVLDPTTLGSLEELNALLGDYIMTYNNTVHSAIDATPTMRFEADMQSVRRVRDAQWISEQFLNRISRRVKGDMTIVIDKVSYDVPLTFAGQKVEVRYIPGDEGSVHIIKEAKKWPLAPTNKTDNYKTRRNNTRYSIDYLSDKEGEDV